MVRDVALASDAPERQVDVPVDDEPAAEKALPSTASTTDGESSQSVPTSLAASRMSGTSSAGRSVDEGSNSFLVKSSLSSAASSQNGNLKRLSSVMGAGSLMRTSVHMMELNQLRFDRTDSDICGRDGEMKTLRDAYNRLMARPSSIPDIADEVCAATNSCTASCGVELVLVGGSAGTGKSTLIQHFADKY